MRFSVAAVTIFAVSLLPATLAVEINSGELTWAPGEECAELCFFKQVNASALPDCSWNSTFPQAQTCTCGSDDFVDKVDACIRAECPDQHDAAAALLPSICAGQSDFPLLTLTDGCDEYCTYQGIEEAFKVDKCLLTPDPTCQCTSAAFTSSYNECARATCGPIADDLIRQSHEGCPASSTTSPTQPTGTPAKSTPGDAGERTAAVNSGAMVVALAVFISLV